MRAKVLRMRMTRILLAAIVLAAVMPLSSMAFPDRPIQYIVPFPPGGESDIAARFQQVAFRKKYNQEMIVINKAGAGGGLAWSQLNSISGDGYTIMGINLPHIVLQPLEGVVQYKTEDLTPIYYFHYTPDAIVVPTDSPYMSFADMVKAAKANPEQITLAGSGTNSANHLAHEKFNALAGVKTTYVPFKGTGDLITSVLGKHVSGAVSYVTFAIQQKGKLRMLGVAMEKRHPLFPDVPTFRELGLDWVDGAYRGVAVPKSTPMDLRKQLSDIMDAVNKDPELRRQMADNGFEVIDIPLDKIAVFSQERAKDYVAIAKRMGLVK